MKRSASEPGLRMSTFSFCNNFFSVLIYTLETPMFLASKNGNNYLPSICGVVVYNVN